MLVTLRWSIRTLLLVLLLPLIPFMWVGFLGAWLVSGRSISPMSPLELYNSAFQHYMSGEAFGPLDDFANKD